MKLTPLGIQPVNGQSAFLLEAGDECILLDAGNSIETPLNLSRVRKLSCDTPLLITHAHRDHSGALPQILAESPFVRPFAVNYPNCQRLPYYLPLEEYQQESYPKSSPRLRLGLLGRHIRLIPAGHSESAAAVQVGDFLLYTGDFHCQRSLRFRGISPAYACRFLLSECSLTGLVRAFNPLAPVNSAPRRQDVQTAQEILLSAVAVYAVENASVLNNSFMRGVRKSTYYQIIHSHADFRSVLLLAESCWPQCLLLTHCDRLSVCRRSAELLRAALPCQVEICQGAASCQATAYRTRFQVRRRAFAVKVKKFIRKCEKAGILLDECSGFRSVGRNLFAEGEDGTLVITWVDDDEASVFLAIAASLREKASGKAKNEVVKTFWD